MPQNLLICSQSIFYSGNSSQGCEESTSCNQTTRLLYQAVTETGFRISPECASEFINMFPVYSLQCLLRSCLYAASVPGAGECTSLGIFEFSLLWPHSTWNEMHSLWGFFWRWISQNSQVRSKVKRNITASISCHLCTACFHKPISHY